MAIFSTKDLVKTFESSQGTIKALDQLTIEIPKGATALLGPNGSGKSTLIKIFLGLLQPTSGSFKIFGKKENKALERNRIGYMPETPSIITKTNAVKYVRHFGILSGLSWTKAMQRAHEVLDYTGLDEARYREINDYSTGMKQRLLFAQALVHDPEIIILDEPTTGLSPEGRDEMLSLINEINSQYGKNILFSTHILPDVENICDYTVLINRGKEIFQGDYAEIKRRFKISLLLDVGNKHQKAKELFENQGYQVDRKWGKLIINSQNSDPLPNLREVNKILSSEGISVLSLRHQQPNLEDLFLSEITADINKGGN